MRPSFSVTLEPGLDRGVPWGRDLYTFVTSAAGHMMRTLQKPRKNRPSKRQVNHRRFLHNMIQRKFADIEAANCRLASALYFKEDDKNLPSLLSQKPEEPGCSGSPSRGGCLQDPDGCSVHTGADGISGDASSGSYEIQTSAKKWLESGHLWKRHPKSQLAAARNNQSKGGGKKKNRQQKQVDITSLNPPVDCHYGAELYHTDCYDEESPLTLVHGFSEDSQTTQPDSSFTQFDQNVDASPGLSPLSLDSCDFSIQMFTDISSCAQAQKNMADVSESLWTDIVDLFNIGSKDLAGCVDVDTCFDGGQEVSPDDAGFAHQSEGLTEMCGDRSEMEDQSYEENEYGYNWNRDQAMTVSHFKNTQNEDAVGTWFNNPEQTQGRDITQNQLRPSCCQYYTSQLYQRPQLEGPCMLGNSLSFTPFEGVAQSFSAPLHHPKHPVLTLPQDEDWLFTDILKDRRSPGSHQQMCFS